MAKHIEHIKAHINFASFVSGTYLFLEKAYTVYLVYTLLERVLRWRVGCHSFHFSFCCFYCFFYVCTHFYDFCGQKCSKIENLYLLLQMKIDIWGFCKRSPIIICWNDQNRKNPPYHSQYQNGKVYRHECHSRTNLWVLHCYASPIMIYQICITNNSDT